jgi:L-iditol 2-dehydrogenase
MTPQALKRTPQGPALTPITPPTPGPGEARLRVLLAGICRTDIEAARGGIPCAEGRTLGHEAVAAIEAIGPNIHPEWLGARVGLLPLRPCQQCPACLTHSPPHPPPSPPTAPHLPTLTQEALTRLAHCEAPQHVGVESDGAFTTHTLAPIRDLYPIPPHLTLPRAAYIEPVAAALAPAALIQGEEVWVWGEGRVAALTLRCLRARGIRARAYPSAELTEPPLGLQCVIETEARREGLEGPIRALAPGGLLILKSRLISPSGFPLGLAVRKGLRLAGAHYAPFAEAIALLSDPNFEVEDLFGASYPLSDFERAFSESEARKVFFDPTQTHMSARG